MAPPRNTHGGGPELPQEETWETSDLGTAAFVHLRGLPILGARRVEGDRFVFRFRDPEGVGEALQIDYLNSDCRKFDEAVRSLKKLCYDRPQRSRR